MESKERREARREKILKNSKKRLQKIENLKGGVKGSETKKTDNLNETSTSSSAKYGETFHADSEEEVLRKRRSNKSQDSESDAEFEEKIHEELHAEIRENPDLFNYTTSVEKKVFGDIGKLEAKFAFMYIMLAFVVRILLEFEIVEYIMVSAFIPFGIISSLHIIIKYMVYADYDYVSTSLWLNGFIAMMDFSATNKDIIVGLYNMASDATSYMIIYLASFVISHAIFVCAKNFA